MMSLSAICQIDSTANKYPKKIVYQGDTLVAITLEHVDSINISYVNLDECREINDTLYVQLDRYKELDKEQKEKITILEDKVDLKDEIIAEKDLISEEKDKKLKKKDRTIRNLKIQRGVLGGGLGAGIIAILILVFGK